MYRKLNQRAFSNTRSLKTRVAKIDNEIVRIRNSNDAWISTIGLEVHAQLLSKTKLFSRASAAYGHAANSQVSFFDAAIPGTLPVINKKAVDLATKAALALNCRINPVSTFDRKHYFYADLPTGYQITQQRKAIANDGHLDFIVMKSPTVKESYGKRASIIQLQLEQDSGKSMHDDKSNQTLVDLNRCGSGLIEIVFGPDLFDGEDAAGLVKELSLVLQWLDICTCQMEEGALRVDANVSVRPFGSDQLGVRTEVKNINSVRGLVNAIEFEVDRQIEILESGGLIENETRSYDGNSKTTVPMRDKEVKQDYRFMPEPNLPPLRLKDIDKIKLPELPSETRFMLQNQHGLSLDLSLRLVNDRDLLDLFLEAQNFPVVCQKTLAHLVVIDTTHLCTKHFKPFKKCVKPSILVEVANMKARDEISTMIVTFALESFISDSTAAKYDRFDDFLADKGWLDTFRNEDLINSIINKVAEDNPKIVKKFVKSRQPKILQSLISQVLSVNGILDPVLVKKLLCQKLTGDE